MNKGYGLNWHFLSDYFKVKQHSLTLLCNQHATFSRGQVLDLASDAVEAVAVGFVESVVVCHDLLGEPEIISKYLNLMARYK